jgi:hypothetical protein
MCKCKACDADFYPNIIYKKNEKGEKTNIFDRFEDLCSSCEKFCWTEASYEELFEERWVKPVKNT